MLYRLKNGSPRVNMMDLSVVVGMHNQGKRELSKKRHSVRKLITHEHFVEGTFQYDIALILLRKRIKFNDKISPICVDNSTFPSNTACYTTGWGHNDVHNLYPRECAYTLYCLSWPDYSV